VKRILLIVAIPLFAGCAIESEPFADTPSFRGTTSQREIDLEILRNYWIGRGYPEEEAERKASDTVRWLKYESR